MIQKTIQKAMTEMPERRFEGAFSGKVDTGFPQKMRPPKDSSGDEP
jgi:hypothetical protein